MRREWRKVGGRRGWRTCLGDICRNILPEAGLAKSQRLEPVAVATTRLDLADVVHELGRPGRSKLDAHHRCLPVLPWACVSNCLQRSWLLLAIFGNVACLLAYETLSVLYLNFRLPAFGCSMAFSVAVDARDVFAVPWRWRSKTGRGPSPGRTTARHKPALASLPTSGWPEASLTHHG